MKKTPLLLYITSCISLCIPLLGHTEENPEIEPSLAEDAQQLPKPSRFSKIRQRIHLPTSDKAHQKVAADTQNELTAEPVEKTGSPQGEQPSLTKRRAFVRQVEKVTKKNNQEVVISPKNEEQALEIGDTRITLEEQTSQSQHDVSTTENATIEAQDNLEIAPLHVESPSQTKRKAFARQAEKVIQPKDQEVAVEPESKEEKLESSNLMLLEPPTEQQEEIAMEIQSSDPAAISQEELFSPPSPVRSRPRSQAARYASRKSQ